VSFVDFHKSKGNYLVDSDGNIFLDLFSTEYNPIGYNHEAFIKVLYVSDFCRL
jgi:4-aminobutyrate aminotransferase-like enzyme